LSREKRERILVSGRVQGVWFRDYTREKAQELGLKGWVRNTTDGAVEVLAEGDPNKLKMLEIYLWEGPPLARVLNVEIIEEKILGEALSRFKVTY